MAPITLPVLVCGLATCVLLEFTGWFDYGALMPENVRQVLTRFDEGQQAASTAHSKAKLDTSHYSRHSGICASFPFGGRGLDWFARNRASDGVQWHYR